MKAPDFSYLRAGSIDEALGVLDRFGDEAAVLAGGQSLVAMLNLRIARPGVVLDINRIPGLDAIRDGGDDVVIGATARLAAIEANPLVAERLRLLTSALPHVAHPAVRTRATLGGSLALADPAAELPACCLALGARLRLVSSAGIREVAAEDWFQGLYQTALQAGELITEIRIPKPPPGSVSRFVELARRRGDFAMAGIALSTRLEDRAFQAPRLALLGVGDRPLLAHATMRAMQGRTVCDVDDGLLAAALDEDADPLEDPACPPAYRRHVLRVLVRRALDELTATAP
jgi:carbon-monoxide dehydrogenase medium subunit